MKHAASATRRRHRRPGGSAVRALCAALAIALGAGAAEAQVVPKQMPEPVRGLELKDKRGEQVPGSISFFDEDGNAVKLSQYFERDGKASDGSSRQFKKPLVVLMMYYSCPLQCPQTLDGLHQVLNGLDAFTIGSEYDVLVVSFDSRDKPRDAKTHKSATLLAYNRQTTESIRDGVHFLTGSPASSRSLADALGYDFRFLPESGEFSHPTAVYVLTPEGKVSRQFNGVRFPARDLRFALMEASSGRIGDTFDQFTFWCYHFDPSTGGYTLAAMRVMQIGGAITAVVLGGALVLLLRQERVKARRRLLAALGGAAGAPNADSGEGAGGGRGRSAIDADARKINGNGERASAASPGTNGLLGTPLRAPGGTV